MIIYCNFTSHSFLLKAFIKPYIFSLYNLTMLDKILLNILRNKKIHFFKINKNSLITTWLLF